MNWRKRGPWIDFSGKTLPRPGAGSIGAPCPTCSETSFSRGLCGALWATGGWQNYLYPSAGLCAGIQDIQSPTFTIVREHREGRLPLFHFDAYRLESSEELYAIGYDDYLSEAGVFVMEWCENVPDALPAQRLEIHLSGSGLMPRSADIYAFGGRYASILEDLPCGC